jgi:5-hydroxyisourate hydrolase-like protein (transthyretin family)
MLDPKHPISDYLDDFLHGVLSADDAAQVQGWLDSAPEAADALAAAQRRYDALAQVPTVEASERLIRTTLERLEMKATKKQSVAGPVVKTFLALAALAIVALGGLSWYYYQLAPSPYSLRLIGQNSLLAGSPAALRLAVVEQQSGQPIANVPVTLALFNAKTQETVELASFTTGAESSDSPRFQLPDWPSGDYTLQLKAITSSGVEELSETITLARSFKLMLSTDKPIYQPGQILHLRSLALRRPDLKPVAEEQVIFQVLDAKGNVIFKRRTTSSKYGIASADCQLATELNQGEFQLVCTVGDTTSRKTVKVERYTLPKFKVSVDFDQPFYAPQDHVHGTVDAQYFFGEPVAGGEVKLDVRAADGISQPIHEETIPLDEKGQAKFAFELPEQLIGRPQDGGNARVQVFATVSDTAGQTYTATAARLVTAQPIQLEVIPEGGALVRALANRVFIHASYADGRPAEVQLQINAEADRAATNSLGVAVIEVTPRDATERLTIVATDKENRVGRKHVELTCGVVAGDFILRPNQAVFRGGDTLQLAANGGGVEPVFVDLIKDGQTLLSDRIDMSQGSGTLAIDLPPDVFGSLELVAYRFDNSGLAVRKSRLIFVHQASELKLTAEMDQPEYRPGKEAQITFKLTDDEGKPTPGAISLAIVDEKVFSVLSQRPGLEQAFFLAEQELLKPIYTIYPGWTPNESSSPSTPRPERELLEEAVFAATAYSSGAHEFKFDSGHRGSGNDTWDGGLVDEAVAPADEGLPPLDDNTIEPVFADSPFTLVANSFPAKAEAVADARRWGLQRVAMSWFVFFSLSFVSAVVLFAVFKPRAFMITAGVLVVLALCGGPLLMAGAWFFLGIAPSAQLAKMEAVATGEAMRWDESAAMDMAMPMEDLYFEGEAFGMGGIGGGSAPPRVRQYFPETLLWQPELITDDEGVATLDLALADSITTWRISASAVSGQGQLGDAQIPLKVFQPFFVDLNLPVALTRHDEVSVPVVVYNYLDKPQTVTLTLDQRDWFELLDPSGGPASDDSTKITVDLKPREVRSFYYRLKILNVGHQQLKVTALAGETGDAIEQTIDVVPNGRLVESQRSGTLDEAGVPVEMIVSIPEDVIPGSVQGFLKLHPSGFSQLVEGLDAIFQMPYGCFEQTSSTTYPNVLALDYLLRTHKSVPQVEAKARQYIHLGYQRLVSYEVPGGGFDWFGNPPSNRTLTAYGLLEFADMARVHDVDPNLIRRTRDWLLSQRRPDGSWEPEPHMLNDGLAASVNREGDADLAATAYIAWAVFHSAPVDARSPNDQTQFQVTADYLLAHKPESIADPYVLATVSMALAAYDPKSPELDGYLARLDALKHTDGKLCWWDQPQGSARPFYGSGDAGKIETTAMATLALLTARQHPGSTRGALTWLVANKDPQGTWHSTQATVLALKALILGTAGDEVQQERHFVVRANEVVVQELTIAPDQSDVLTQLDLSPWLTKIGDDNTVSVTETTDTATSFQCVFRHWVETPVEETPEREPLAISIVYDRERLSVDETVTATATIINQMEVAAPMVILDLPIPGGFAIDQGELDELVGSNLIAKYEITPRQAIVYLRELAPGAKLELRYRLRAIMPVKVTVPAGQAYEYYNPASRGTAQPARLEVIEA